MMPKCSECHGTGLTDNHVTGEVCCSACDGTGIDDDKAQYLSEPAWCGHCGGTCKCGEYDE